jgi:flagellar basal-body rod modification protein FlgD
MAVSPTSSTGAAAAEPNFVKKDEVGIAGLDSTVFLKLLIAQLQNQDPTQPTDNEQILSQLSTMRNLQANIELSDTLKGFTSGEQITTGAAFLGKLVTGKTEAGQDVSGVADRVFVENGKTRIGIGDKVVEVSKVTGVSLPQAA